MTLEELDYRSFLKECLGSAKGELQLHLQREIDQLDWIGWNKRIICSSCKGLISLERLKDAIRTTNCQKCAAASSQLPYQRLVVVPVST